jgi:hypothetical protein
VNKKKIVAIILCLILILTFGACGSTKDGDAGSEKTDDVVKLQDGILAQVGDFEISEDQVNSLAAVMALTTQPVQVYGDLDDADKAKYQNFALIRLVELEALKAKFEKEGVEVLSEEDNGILKNAAAEKYQEWIDEGYDLEAWGVTEETILINYEFIEGYASRFIETNREADGDDVDLEAAYQKLVADSGVIWNDSLTIDKVTGLPTVG